MKLRYKYRIYPNKKQDEQLRQFCGSCRFVWNYYLEKNIERYNLEKKFIFADDMCRDLTKLKREKDWLYDIANMCLQQKLRDLSDSLKNCYKFKFGFPKFKKKSNYSDSMKFMDIRLKENKVRLYKLGWIKQDTHRSLPSKPSSATVILDGDKWYISYVVEKQEETEKEISKLVGIDVGLESFITTDKNIKIENPRFLDKSLKKLKRTTKKTFKKTKWKQ